MFLRGEDSELLLHSAAVGRPLLYQARTVIVVSEARPLGRATLSYLNVPIPELPSLTGGLLRLFVKRC